MVRAPAQVRLRTSDMLFIGEHFFNLYFVFRRWSDSVFMPGIPSLGCDIDVMFAPPCVLLVLSRPIYRDEVQWDIGTWLDGVMGCGVAIPSSDISDLCAFATHGGQYGRS